MKNISLANNPFAKTPSTKPSVSRNKKVICSQKSFVNNTSVLEPAVISTSSDPGMVNFDFSASMDAR